MICTRQKQLLAVVVALAAVTCVRADWSSLASSEQTGPVSMRPQMTSIDYGECILQFWRCFAPPQGPHQPCSSVMADMCEV